MSLNEFMFFIKKKEIYNSNEFVMFLNKKAAATVYNYFKKLICSMEKRRLRKEKT